MRNCKRCNGKGSYDYFGEERTCSRCGGRGTFDEPDYAAIFKAVTTSRGAAKGRRRFRAGKPPAADGDPRVYFVWRLARFHGGADVTMPVWAMTLNDGDPYEPELDAFASDLARRVFGTDLAAAYRWAGALGGDVQVPDGLPASAYSCGPVADGNKPAEEAGELH